MRIRLGVTTTNLVSAQERLKNSFQRTAPAKEAELHRFDAAFQDFGDFLVAQAFEVSQNHRAAKNIVNLLQSAVHDYPNFQRRKLLEGRRATLLELGARFPFQRRALDGQTLLH